MKVLIAAGVFPHKFSFSLPHEIGGPATYSKKISEELLSRGFEIKILHYGEGNNRYVESAEMISVNRYVNIFFRYFIYFLRIVQLSKWTDVIYAQGPISEGVPAWLATKLNRKKYVLKIVGDYAWEQGRQRFGVQDFLDDFQAKKYGIKVELMRWFQRRVALSADRIIVPSGYLKTIVIGWGVPSQKIEVIYNAMEFKEIAPKQHAFEERWIVTVGRLVPWKGMETLIEVMPEILKEIPQAKLKIIGHGPEMEDIKSQVERQKLGQAVELCGAVTHDETLSYIHAADVFVLNSGYEGLSHVILEALSFGRPVLASNVGGNPEAVIPGKTGDLFEYNNREEMKNKIIDVLKNKRVINPMLTSEERIPFFKKFHLDAMVEKTIAVFHRVAGSKEKHNETMKQ